MTKFIIEITQDHLNNNQIASIFEIVASAIRDEELVELMDGSYQLETTFGKVWLNGVVE